MDEEKDTIIQKDGNHRLSRSQSIKELAAAMAKAQAVIGTAHKDKSNPFFKSNYADLSSVWDACREALTKNGLSVLQPTFIEDGKTFLETTLIHSSGEWISGILQVKPVKDDPQGMGSALTYARRYGLSALVGVSPADDDGEGSMNRNQGNSSSPKPPMEPPKSKSETDPNKATQKQMGKIQAMFKDINPGMNSDAKREMASKITGKELLSMSDLTKDDARTLIDGLAEIKTREGTNYNVCENHQEEDCGVCQGK